MRLSWLLGATLAYLWQGAKTLRKPHGSGRACSSRMPKPGRFIVPAVGQPWINAFAATPGRSVAALLVIAVLLARSRNLQTQTRDDMRALWEGSLELDLVPGERCPRL